MRCDYILSLYLLRPRNHEGSAYMKVKLINHVDDFDPDFV